MQLAGPVSVQMREGLPHTHKRSGEEKLRAVFFILPTMEPPSITRVKICCIGDHFEAHLAANHGASAIGLVSEMPSGPGAISEKEIKYIARLASARVDRVLLTSKRNAREIIRQLEGLCIWTVQLVDAVDRNEYEIMRAEIPDVRLVQVIHILGEESLGFAVAAAQLADALLLDSGRPHLPVPELGGTGRRHDWSVSARIRAEVPIPVYLAGGLNAENVGEAIATVKPFGVDVCSGVRTNGMLDEEKLSAFIGAVRAADPSEITFFPPPAWND